MSPLVWVFYPDTRTVSVYRADGQAARLGVGETLSDAEVLPGFTCLVADVFPSPRSASLGLDARHSPPAWWRTPALTHMPHAQADQWMVEASGAKAFDEPTISSVLIAIRCALTGSL